MSRNNALEELVGSMTVAELAEKAGRHVSEIAQFALSGQKPKTRSNGGYGRQATPLVAKPVDTRTAAGREAYRQAVLDAIRSATGYVDAHEVRSKVGGTPQQFRATVNHLIAGGDVTYTGKARATRYTAA